MSFSHWLVDFLGGVCFPIGWDIIPIPNHHPKFFGPSSGMNLISEVAKLSRAIYGPTKSYRLVVWNMTFMTFHLLGIRTYQMKGSTTTPEHFLNMRINKKP